MRRSDTALRKTQVARNPISVVDDDESAGTRTRAGIEDSSYVPTAFEFAEEFGGGSDYFPFWCLSLWPFKAIRFGTQEE
jgi:hypothetical protein